MYENVMFATRMTFRRFWVMEPHHSENNLVEMLYLYRGTRAEVAAVILGVESPCQYMSGIHPG